MNVLCTRQRHEYGATNIAKKRSRPRKKKSACSVPCVCVCVCVWFGPCVALVWSLSGLRVLCVRLRSGTSDFSEPKFNVHTLSAEGKRTTLRKKKETYHRKTSDTYLKKVWRRPTSTVTAHLTKILLTVQGAIQSNVPSLRGYARVPKSEELISCECGFTNAEATDPFMEEKSALPRSKCRSPVMAD